MTFTNKAEIHVRLYNAGALIGGRIWPMTSQQKEELYSILYKCVNDWDCDDYSGDESDSVHLLKLYIIFLTLTLRQVIN